MRLVGVAVLGGDQRPARAVLPRRFGGQSADASLPGQQLRPESYVPGEAALKLADAEVELVGQPSHRYPPAAGLGQPDLARDPAGRRWLPRLAMAASIIAALAVGAGAVYQGTAADRRLADSYRAVLAQGYGSFFTAAPVHRPTGTTGTVFGY